MYSILFWLQNYWFYSKLPNKIIYFCYLTPKICNYCAILANRPACLHEIDDGLLAWDGSDESCSPKIVRLRTSVPLRVFHMNSKGCVLLFGFTSPYCPLTLIYVWFPPHTMPLPISAAGGLCRRASRRTTPATWESQGNNAWDKPDAVQLLLFKAPKCRSTDAGLGKHLLCGDSKTACLVLYERGKQRINL